MNRTAYTNVVLTIIAAALVMIALDRFSHPQTAQAQQVQRVVIIGWDFGTLPPQGVGFPVSLRGSDGAISVNVVGASGLPFPTVSGPNVTGLPVVMAKDKPATLR